MDKLRKFSQERNDYNKEGRKESIKNRLKQNIRKKMMTVLVGAIDEFEKAFGEVWGHKINSVDKTDGELDFTAVWNQCRDKIFDRGNLQIKGMEKEIDGYEVELIMREYVGLTEDCQITKKYGKVRNEEV